MNQSVDTVDTLVLDWLIRSGYQSTFIKLPASACLNAQIQAESLKFRAQVVDSIKKGRILEAISLIETSAINKNHKFNQSPVELTSLKSIPAGPLPLNQVIYILKLQNFIELVRVRQNSAALSWIQNYLVQESNEYELILQESLGVLVYADPESSSLAWMFEQSHRYSALADLTNSSLYQAHHTNHIRSSPIENLIKHVKAIDGLVHELEGFGSDLDDRKWASIHHLLNQDQKKFIKTIKND